MKEDCGRRHSKKLLDFHEIIVGQILSARCACCCHSRPTRNLFNKILCYDVPSNISDNKGSSQRVTQKSNNQVGPHKTFLKTILDIDINNDELKQCSTQKGHHLCAH
jgi:hypothetical protein